MQNNTILATGLNGLVGSRIAELLIDYRFENISRSTGVNISNSEDVLRAFEKSNADIVLHLAAKTDVDSCEKDKGEGENGEAWKINVLGTQNIISACEKTGKKLFYISTDFVFSGSDTPEKGYSEDDTPDPINWYATTKYEGEQRVKESNTPWIIMRIASPYRLSYQKLDFVRAIKNRLEQKQVVKGVTDQMFCPTFIDDIAVAFRTLIETDSKGIFHVVGSSSVSPYEAVMAIVDAFNLDLSLVEKTTSKEFFENRAPRPFNLSLKNDRIEKLGVTMLPFREGIKVFTK